MSDAIRATGAHSRSLDARGHRLAQGIAVQCASGRLPGAASEETCDERGLVRTAEHSERMTELLATAALEFGRSPARSGADHRERWSLARGSSLVENRNPPQMAGFLHTYSTHRRPRCDSNAQPTDSKSGALSFELRGHRCRGHYSTLESLGQPAHAPEARCRRAERSGSLCPLPDALTNAGSAHGSKALLE
jgi:hypothetical protein